MIPVDPSVKTLLDTSTTLYAADLYTFHLLNGSVLRYTSADQNITFGGNTWLGSGLRIERSKIKVVTGVQVDQLTIDVYPSPSDLVGSNPFVQFAVNGGLDGCYLQIDRAVGPSPLAPITGIIPKRFYGRIGEVSGGRSKLTLTDKSDLDLLNIQMPRVLFQAPCSHSLYDAGCTLLKSTYTVSGTVIGGGSVLAFNTSLTQADGYFTLGVISFTTGVNTGLSRTLKSYVNAGGSIIILQPLPKAPTAGDAFTIYPGCDKTFATCSGKFSNSQNFRGFEFIPNPETSLV